MDDELRDSEDIYGDFFDKEKSLFEKFYFLKKLIFMIEVVIKQQGILWNKTKKLFVSAAKAQKQFRRLVVEHIRESIQVIRKKNIFLQNQIEYFLDKISC
jgi:hypothetical protein